MSRPRPHLPDPERRPRHRGADGASRPTPRSTPGRSSAAGPAGRWRGSTSASRSSSCCRGSCSRGPFFLAIGRGERHPSHRHYLWKRALRILPLYWVVVCVALLFDPANQGLGWQVWVRQLTLTQLYFPTLLPQSLTQMWSLCTEVAFYLADAADGVPPRGLATAPAGSTCRRSGPRARHRRPRRRLAGVVRPHPRARGPLPAVAAGLDADVPGRDVLRGGQRRPDAAAPRRTCSTGWAPT